MQIATTSQQANRTTGAGAVTSGSLVYPITVSARALTVDAIEKLVIALADATAMSAATSVGGATGASAAGRPVTLGQIADVRIAPAPLTAITRTNGKSSIGISISKASSGNTVDIANAVTDELPAITRDLGGQTKITTVVDQSIYIKESITSLWREGLMGAVFAVLIMWVFLWSWRSTLIDSLLVALVVVPVASTWVLSKRQVGHRDADELTRLQRAYLPALKLALDHKVITLVLVVAIFAGTMALTPLLKTNLFDSSAQNTMTVTQQLPPGTSLDATMASAAKVEAILAVTKGVDIYQVTAGSTGSLFGAGGGTSASTSQAVFTVTTNPDMDKLTIIDQVRAKVAKLQNAGAVTVTGEDASNSMGGMSTMEVRVSASDPAVLQEANDIVLKRVKTVDGLADVKSNLSEGRPAATVAIDQAKAAAAGVSASTLSLYTTLILNGYPVGMVPTADGLLPAQIMVQDIRLPPIPGAVSAMLTRLPVPGAKGMVPLSQIATIAEVKAPVQVTHVDGERTASITAAAVNNNIGAASSAVTKAMDSVQMPAGATWSLAGATEATNDVFRTLGIAMLIAILLVYLVMVATFRSLLNPLILPVSIPFAAVGAVIALVATGTALGMPSLLGLLMLIGIVITNAIVLLDLVEQFRRRGMDARSAVIEGGRRRLRPILMTAVATILALTPMALGMRKGGFLSTPLAIVVIGGLFTSTVLTLVLVPVLYLVFDRLRPKNAYANEEDGVVPLEAETSPG